jgi:hypothetical protein
MFNRLCQSISPHFYNPEKQPTPLMDKNWDNAIILDACRYDLFKEANIFEQPLEYRITPSSRTPEFLHANFSKGEYYDTVYITANPMYRTQGLDDVFHEVIDVWNDDWDDDLKTVRPEKMVGHTISAQVEYPNKRILSHFMQPHYPFIGDSAEELGNHSGYELTYRKATNGETTRDNPTVWERLKWGKVDRQNVWDAYRENLELTFPHVREIVRELNGKTVLTSDHGNLLGERPFRYWKKMYGHPAGVRCDQLNKVPWIVFEGENEKMITSEAPNSTKSEPTEIISNRLSNLGYADI